jgi:hypothetical protein
MQLRCQPAAIPVHALGRTGTFHVDTTPNDCRWTAFIYSFYGSILKGQTGTGDGDVTFMVLPNSSSDTVQISGLSGENPPGVHTFEVQ